MAQGGCCGSCVFNHYDTNSANIRNCRISSDPVVEQTYEMVNIDGKHGGVCGKYQLNPLHLDED